VTDFAAKRAEKGQIYSFEPVPDNYKILKTNVSINKLNNVKIYRKSIWSDSGKILIKLGRSSGWHSAFLKKEACIGSISSEALSLREVLKITGGEIDVLKMDCEGCEFVSLSNTPISVLKKIHKIVLEYHLIGDLFRLDNLIDRLKDSNKIVVTEKKDSYISYGIPVETGMLWAWEE